MIRPLPALPRAVPAARRRARHRPSRRCRRFSERDLRDLQVWFNLTWIHPLLFEQDAELREFRDKGRDYTEDEKQWLLDKQLEILRRDHPAAPQARRARARSS